MTSLFSFQFQNPQMSQDYVNKYAASGVKYVKIIDPDKAPWLWPSNVKCIARYHFGNDPEFGLVSQGRAGARTWFSWVKPRIEKTPAVEYVEILCEWNPRTIQECAWLCDFNDEACLLLHSIGKKGIVFNFGVGHPFIGAGRYLINGLKNADALGVHEYKLKSTLGTSIADDYKPENRWWLFRFLRLIDEIKSAGGKVPPVFIGEFLVDQNGDANNDGWRTCLTAIQAHNLSLEYERCCKLSGITFLNIVRFISNNHFLRWTSFRCDGELDDLLIAHIKKEATIVTEPVYKISIDGRLMNAEEFRNHVKSTNLSWASGIVIHHTALPTKAQWATCGWECRKENMRLYYQNTKRWDSGPHLFISDEGIGLFSPLDKPGTGVANQNSWTIHVEIVGDYTNDYPSGKTYDFVIKAVASLVDTMGENNIEIFAHRDLQINTACPGNGIYARWEDLTDAIYKEANRVDLSQEQPTPTKIRWHVEQAVRELEEYGVNRSTKSMQRLYELIKLDGGLLYRFEQGGR